MMKKCGYCKIEKILTDEFNINRRMKDKFEPFCRPCEIIEKNLSKRCNTCSHDKIHSDFSLLRGMRKSCCKICINEKRRQRENIEKQRILKKGKKLCPFCNKWLNMELFEKNSDFKDDYSYICKECTPIEKIQKKTCIECENDKTHNDFAFVPNGSRRNQCKRCINEIEQKRKQQQTKKKVDDITKSLKLCSFCEKYLDLDNFEHNSTFIDNYYPTCIVCTPEEEKKISKCTLCNIVTINKDFPFNNGRRELQCKLCHNKSRKLKNFDRVTTGTKFCPECKTECEVSQFSTASYNLSGLSDYCRKCAQLRAIRYRNTFFVHISHIFRKIMSSKDKIEDIDFDKKYLIELFNKQDGKCAHSNLTMTWIYAPRSEHERKLLKLNPAHYLNISVDRIDSTLGYCKKNIQLVCNIMNIMKRNLSDSNFYWLCSKVTEFQETLDKYPVKQFNRSVTEKEMFDNFMIKRFDSIQVCIRCSKYKDKRGNITQEDLYSIYYAQRGKCAITGINLEHVPDFKVKNLNKRQSKAYDRLFSFDRIDSMKGYNKANVQTTLRVMNYMKNDLSQDVLLNYCKLITIAQSKRNNGIFINSYKY